MVLQWNEYYSEHVENWQVNYQELERIRDEMWWKALEEHEKALQNQEELRKEDEEGMFSDLKEDYDDDLDDDDLFGEY